MQPSPVLEMSLEALFWAVDDFCRSFEQEWQQRLISNGARRRSRARALSLGEMLTIVIAFHQQRYRTFKDFYQRHVGIYWRTVFPQLVSYQRFVEWLSSLLVPLCVYLKHCFGRCSGMTQKEVFSIWVKETEAALAAKRQGIVIDLWKCVGIPRVIAIIDAATPDRLDQILMDLPIMKQMGQHVQVEAVSLRRYEDFAADLCSRVQ